MANRSVDVHQFAMVPRAEIPRSSFTMEKAYKTTFDSGLLIPVFCDEVLPGDTFNLRMTAFARLSTPLFPIMDNLHLQSFFFFVPYRLLWDNWPKFMGERKNPDDSVSYVIPQVVCPAGGYAIGSLQDYFGLPTVGQVAGGATVSHSTLPLRAYNLIFNEWFRDENLQDSVPIDVDDGPDTASDYVLLRRGKRHDYFTSALPWPQKGQSVSIPLGTTAPVFRNPSVNAVFMNDGTTDYNLQQVNTFPYVGLGASAAGNAPLAFGSVANPAATGLVTDLSTATAATINQLRQSFQIQKLLERDARGGTRLTEIIRAHFGVVSPDSRLQRPEYLGGGTSPVVVNPIAQTSATGVTGATTPQGTLAGMGTALASGHGFTQSFTEHGVVLGLVSVRADLTYQQGLRRFWSRSTRYDFYWPAFAALGEQSVLNKEIYVRGDANDNLVFGYQERWAEYRYNPSEITSLFRSTAAGTIDPWHLAQRFTFLPLLNEPFIIDNPPLSRVLAVGAAANGQQFIFDSIFTVRAARPLPMYSVPGLIDHF
ncbi:major capsid protein [robinz microvirus RP_96]|nr:major capsid protein [robinz microvirus RP_96]